MNKKIKINTNDINASGTGLVGYITTTYDKLVEELGEPDTDYDKSTVHWTIQAPDGTVATIYDWKTGCTPRHTEYAWHVEGHKARKALLLVEFVTGQIAVAG
jgi:hypothetical protein